MNPRIVRLTRDFDNGFIRYAMLLNGGIRTYALYTWKALFSKPGEVRDDEATLVSELRRVKHELTQVTEESNVL